jgi:hypothetical protein
MEYSILHVVQGHKETFILPMSKWELVLNYPQNGIYEYNITTIFILFFTVYIRGKYNGRPSLKSLCF